jgi:hypothetical protein
MKKPTKLRIVESSPGMFYVEYKSWWGWSTASSRSENNLDDARRRMARVQAEFDWVPKVHV